MRRTIAIVSSLTLLTAMIGVSAPALAGGYGYGYRHHYGFGHRPHSGYGFSYGYRSHGHHHDGALIGAAAILGFSLLALELSRRDAYYAQPAYTYQTRTVYVAPPARTVYVAPPAQTVYVAPPVAAPAQAQLPPGCLMVREYQTRVVVGGREVDAYGDACLQPDGSWRQGAPKIVPD